MSLRDFFSRARTGDEPLNISAVHSGGAEAPDEAAAKSGGLSLLQRTVLAGVLATQVIGAVSAAPAHAADLADTSPGGPAIEQVQAVTPGQATIERLKARFQDNKFDVSEVYFIDVDKTILDRALTPGKEIGGSFTFMSPAAKYEAAEDMNEGRVMEALFDGRFNDPAAIDMTCSVHAIEAGLIGQIGLFQMMTGNAVSPHQVAEVMREAGISIDDIDMGIGVHESQHCLSAPSLEIAKVHAAVLVEATATPERLAAEGFFGQLERSATLDYMRHLGETLRHGQPGQAALEGAMAELERNGVPLAQVEAEHARSIAGMFIEGYSQLLDGGLSMGDAHSFMGEGYYIYVAEMLSDAANVMEMTLAGRENYGNLLQGVRAAGFFAVDGSAATPTHYATMDAMAAAERQARDWMAEGHVPTEAEKQEVLFDIVGRVALPADALYRIDHLRTHAPSAALHSPEAADLIPAEWSRTAASFLNQAGAYAVTAPGVEARDAVRATAEAYNQTNDMIAQLRAAGDEQSLRSYVTDSLHSARTMQNDGDPRTDALAKGVMGALYVQTGVGNQRLVEAVLDVGGAAQQAAEASAAGFVQTVSPGLRGDRAPEAVKASSFTQPIYVNFNGVIGVAPADSGENLLPETKREVLGLVAPKMAAGLEASLAAPRNVAAPSPTVEALTPKAERAHDTAELQP